MLIPAKRTLIRVEICLFLMASLTLLAGCSGSNCTFPCWMDIEPGRTTANEVEQTLRSQPGAITIDEWNGEVWDIEWTPAIPSEYEWADLSFRNEIVERIRLYPPEGELSVEEFSGHYGDPDLVWVVVALSTDAKCAGSFLVWNSLGVEAYLYSDHSPGRIVPSTTIYSVELVTPPPLLPTDTFEFEWQGYMNYCILIERTPTGFRKSP